MNRPLKIWMAILVGFHLSIAATIEHARATEILGLRVGVSPVFPPMVFKQGKNLAGVEIELARALGDAMGRSVTFVELPWEEQIEALNAGRIDIIMSSMSITPARRFVVDFSQPYLVIG